MSNHRQPRPRKVPKHPPTHNRHRPPTDARPHVTALRELAALGWRVVEIRPDREPPVLWTVRARRFDDNVEIVVHEADPDAALEEVLHFAACDEDEPSVELPPEGVPPPTDGTEGTPGDPLPPTADTPESTPSVGSLRTRDELEAALSALGWTIVTGLVQTANGWKATMRRGTANVPMTGVRELDLLESMLQYAQKRGGSKP